MALQNGFCHLFKLYQIRSGVCSYFVHKYVFHADVTFYISLFITKETENVMLTKVTSTLTARGPDSFFFTVCPGARNFFNQGASNQTFLLNVLKPLC